jgi:transcriptional regulator with XRE-family HTH domain
MNGGLIIKELRRRAGLTQTALSRRLDLPQSGIARWESGAISPRFDTLQRVAEACGLSLQVLIGPQTDADIDQVRERLAWTPMQRLRYLEDMLAFEEQAHRAQVVRRV